MKKISRHSPSNWEPQQGGGGHRGTLTRKEDVSQESSLGITSLVLGIKLYFCLLLNVKIITAGNEIPAKLLSCKAASWGRADER